MPDIGTLNLTIESNAQQAADGLDQLARKLKSVKSNSEGYDLSNVQTQISNIVNAVKGSEKTVSALGTLFNSISTYYKTFSKMTANVTINTKPIEDLRLALDDGIKIGQAGTQLNKLREAIEGEWKTDNAYNAGMALAAIGEGAKSLSGTSLGTHAKNISGIATAISEFAKSIEELKTATTGGIAGTQMPQFTEAGGDAASGYAQGFLQGKEAIVNVVVSVMQAAIEAVRKTQESHSPSLVFMRLGVYAAEGYIEGVKSKMMDVAGTLADMTKTAIISAKDKAPEAAMQVAEAIRSTFKTVLSSDFIPDAVKAPLAEGVERIASFVQALVGSASKDQYAQAATMASAAVREGLSTAISQSFGLLKSETGVQAVETEVAGIFKQVETPIQHVNSELQETKQTVEGIANACKPAKAIIASTLKEFEKSEKNGSFASWMYGPRPPVAYTNTNGMQPGYQTDEEAREKNPQWYKPEEYYSALAEAAKEAKPAIDSLNQSIKETTSATSGGFQHINDILVNTGATGEYLDYLNSRKSVETTNETISEHVSLIQTLKDAYANARAEGDRFNIGIGSLGTAMKSMFPTITGLLKRFRGMMIMRTMRYLIRQLAAGLSEGIKNVYYYSQAIGGDFAPAMDSAASALAQMKNSIGAALAPAIQALLPYLQMAINAFINLINYVNQFFALMRGQKTWTHAINQTTTAYDDLKKKAKGASKAAKDLLADWDELNIIQSQGGGAGGAGSGKDTPDYANMFEEVSEFSERIRNLVLGIEEHFGSVWNLIKKIGIALLGWKLSNAFTGLLGMLGGLIGTSVTIGLVFEISKLFTEQYLETGEKGWLLGDVLMTLVGGTIAKKILGKVAGGALAKIAIPLTFAVSAAASIITLIKDTDTSVLSEKSLLTAITAGVEGGIGVGVGIGSLAGYSTAAAFGAGVGGALFTFGVAIGLKAIATKLDVGEFTPEVIGANFLSAGAIGAGLFLTEVALGGSVMTALTLAGGAAILTLAALFAIEAVIQKEPETVRFGDFKATKAEIEDYVNNKLYKEPPEVKISLINATFEPLGENKQNLSEKAQSIIGTIEAAKVGIMTTPDEMQTQIDDWIKAYNETSHSYKNALEVALSIAPLSGENGESETAEIVKNSSERWSELDGIMAQLGQDLADAYKVAYDARLKGNIDETAEKTIKEITDMMARVSAAVATGKSKARAGAVLEEQINNLSKETLQGILDTYREQRDKLIAEMTEAREGAAEGVKAQQYAYEELAAYALKDAGGNTADKTYQYYKKKAEEAKKDYERLLVDLKSDVEEAANNFIDPEQMEKLRRFLIDSVVNSLNPDDIEEELAKAGYYDIDIKLAPHLVGVLSGNDSELQKNEVQDIIDRLLTSLVGNENFEMYKGYIESGVLKYSNFFSEEFMNNLADQLGLKGKQKRRWNEIVDELFNNPKQGTAKTTPSWLSDAFTGLEENARTTVDKVKSMFDELNDEVIKINIQEYLNNSPVSGSFYGKGNIDLNNRQVLNNNDGTFSTENSSTIEIDGKYIVIPTVIDGKQLDIEDAIDHYMNTGEHLGMFDSLKEADTYAQLLHERQEELYAAKQAVLGYLDSLNSGDIDQGMFDSKIDMLKYKFSEELINSILESLTSQNTGTNLINQLGQKPLRVSGAMGMSDVGWTPINYAPSNANATGEGQIEAEIDTTQMASSVETGSRKANADVVSELRSAVQVLQRILAKPWVVNVQPTSALGRTVGQAGAAFGRATGDN